MNTFTDIAT